MVEVTGTEAQGFRRTVRNWSMKKGKESRFRRQPLHKDDSSEGMKVLVVQDVC